MLVSSRAACLTWDTGGHWGPHCGQSVLRYHRRKLDRDLSFPLRLRQSTSDSPAYSGGLCQRPDKHFHHRTHHHHHHHYCCLPTKYLITIILATLNTSVLASLEPTFAHLEFFIFSFPRQPSHHTPHTSHLSPALSEVAGQ